MEDFELDNRDDLLKRSEAEGKLGVLNPSEFIIWFRLGLFGILLLLLLLLLLVVVVVVVVVLVVVVVVMLNPRLHKQSLMI